MNISYSRVSSYCHCPFKHYIGYVEKLEPKIPVKALSFGSDFHKLLENRGKKSTCKQAWKEIEAAYNDLTGEQQGALGDNYLEDLKTIFGDYMRYWQSTEAEMPTEIELLFEIPMGEVDEEELVFKGVIDELYFEPGSHIGIGEHKTFKYAPAMDLLTMNMQVCLYAKAIEFLYEVKAAWVRWDYIKSTPAAEPIWLDKSGRFSAAASQSITPYSYERARKKRGIELEPGEVCPGEEYRANLSNFFFRHQLDIVPEMVDAIWKDFRAVAREIAKKGDKNKRKNVSRDCSWCSYRPICYAEFTGADVDYIKEKDFQVRKREETLNAGTEDSA